MRGREAAGEGWWLGGHGSRGNAGWTRGKGGSRGSGPLPILGPKAVARPPAGAPGSPRPGRSPKTDAPPDPTPHPTPADRAPDCGLTPPVSRMPSHLEVPAGRCGPRRLAPSRPGMETPGCGTRVPAPGPGPGPGGAGAEWAAGQGPRLQSDRWQVGRGGWARPFSAGLRAGSLRLVPRSPPGDCALLPATDRRFCGP